MSSVNKTIGFTQLEKKQADFTWVIRDFKCIWNEKIKLLQSPSFKFGESDPRLFCLTLQRDINEGETSAYLSCREKDDDFEFVWKSSIIKDGVIVDSDEGTKWTCRIAGFLSTSIFTTPSNNMKQYISSTNTVIIRCEVTTPVKSTKSLSHEFANTNTTLVPQFNLDWMYLNESFSDVKLRAHGLEIPAHKVVLAAASPVFKAMFTLDMLENKSDSFDMSDIGSEATREMLRYIYTGRVKKTTYIHHIDKILEAADKYQIEGLKNECETILCSLNDLKYPENFKIPKLIEKYNMERLKRKQINI